MPDVPTAPVSAGRIDPPARSVATSNPRPRGSRAVRVTAAVAVIGVVVALVGLALSARPLRTPTQDCGTALTFLVQGRVDELVDSADLPAGVTKAEAEANNTEPCQERAANRALPAGVAVVGGTLVALVMLIVEWAVRLTISRAARRTGLDHGEPRSGVTMPVRVSPPPPPPTA